MPWVPADHEGPEPSNTCAEPVDASTDIDMKSIAACRMKQLWGAIITTSVVLGLFADWTIDVAVLQ